MGKRLLILLLVAVGIFLAIAAVGGGLAGLFYYRGYTLWDNPVANYFSARPVPTAPSNEGLGDGAAFGTENNWIASTISAEIADWAWLALHPKNPVPNFVALANVNPQEGHVHLELSDWVADKSTAADFDPAFAWDPVGYAAFARQLLGDAKSSEPTDLSADADYLNDLLTPTGPVLAAKDMEVSRQLADNPLSVDLHERASLLLLTLASRENAGSLSDSRRLICRATAHLALAKALRGDAPASWVGWIADAFLRTQSGREAEAGKELDSLSTQSDAPPAAQTWIRALKLTNKMDWRMETPDENYPLLLKLAWSEAVAENLSDALAANYLDRLGKLDDIPDWGRQIISGTEHLGVDVGSRFGAPTLSLELKEIVAVIKAEDVPVTSGEPLSELLSAPMTRSIAADDKGANSVHVVGLGLFEDIARRHLMNAAIRTHYWMKNSWGVPDEDAKFLKEMSGLFSGMKHADYYDKMIERTDETVFPPSGDFHDDLADIPPCLPFALVWPERDGHRLMTYFAWGSPYRTSYFIKTRCVVVYGTTFKPCDPTTHAPSFAELSVLQPSSYINASWALLLRLDRHETIPIETMRAAVSPFFDYNTYALTYFLQSAEGKPGFTDEMEEGILRKSAAINPDVNFHLAEFLMAHGKEDEAADVYRRAAASATDQVVFANNIRPLVEYDFKHNKVGEATDLAKRAADVFSASGIETYTWLLIQEGQFDQAEDLAKQQQNRYNDDIALFYARYRDHFPEKYAAALKQVVPGGLVDVKLTDLSGPPKDGCRFSTSSAVFEQAGFKAGDVVVGLDGHAIHSLPAFLFIRELNATPRMDFIVWRDGKYLELTASPPNHRFGNNIVNFP